jgi:hypothetical protein
MSDKVLVYYFIEDGQDGSARLKLYKTEEARDRAMEHSLEQYGMSELDEGKIWVSDIDNAQTLEEVEAEIGEYN